MVIDIPHTVYMNWHARASAIPVDLATRVTVVLIELLSQLMSTFIIGVHTRCQMKKHASRPRSCGSLTKAQHIHLLPCSIANRDTMDPFSLSLSLPFFYFLDLLLLKMKTNLNNSPLILSFVRNNFK